MYLFLIAGCTTLLGGAAMALWVAPLTWPRSCPFFVVSLAVLVVKAVEWARSAARAHEAARHGSTAWQWVFSDMLKREYRVRTGTRVCAGAAVLLVLASGVATAAVRDRDQADPFISTAMLVATLSALVSMWLHLVERAQLKQHLAAVGLDEESQESSLSGGPEGTTRSGEPR